jgi:hypothetical protein
MAVNKGVTHKISQKQSQLIRQFRNQKVFTKGSLGTVTLIEPEKIQQMWYQPGKKNITGI